MERRPDDQLGGDVGGSPIGGVEASRLFERVFAGHRRVLLAVSGGADSTALLTLAAEWSQGSGAAEIAVATVDHGLRPEAEIAAEIEAVAALSRSFGAAHRRLQARLASSQTRIEEAARKARYAALAGCALEIGAGAVATAHTLDDQAETVLLRLAAGSGPAGLRAMAEISHRGGVAILRPFLGIARARLVASLEARGLQFAHDPMNADPRFARARLRAARKTLAREGLSAERLGTLAFRMARAEAALESALEAAAVAHLARNDRRRVIAPAAAGLPDELKLRLLGRAVAEAGGGTIRLERLERLADRIIASPEGVGTLAGAKVSWTPDGRIVAEPEPPRGRRGDGSAKGL